MYSQKHTIKLSLFGVNVHISCTSEVVRDDIETYFSQFLIASKDSPEIMIEYKLPTSERRLFRAVDINLAFKDDIKIISKYNGEIKEWEYNSPLIPSGIPSF